MSKLKVQELESRVAPGYGLFSFLTNLASQDSTFGDIFNTVVDPQTGDVDVDTAVGMANDAGLGVQSVRPSFTLSDDIVISDKTAGMIMSFFGK